MITDLLGEIVIEGYSEWREKFMSEFGIITYETNAENQPWSAFIGNWDYFAEYCQVMEKRNEIRFGNTEREALEALAKCRRYKLFA